MGTVSAPERTATGQGAGMLKLSRSRKGDQPTDETWRAGHAWPARVWRMWLSKPLASRFGGGFADLGSGDLPVVEGMVPISALVNYAISPPLVFLVG